MVFVAPVTNRGDKAADFERVDPARAAADYARLTEEFKLADAAVAHASLDDTFTHNNELMSLRLIYLHMIEEYARHLGHADLLREIFGNPSLVLAAGETEVVGRNLILLTPRRARS